MHNAGNNNFNSHNRISIGFDLFGEPVELSKSGKQQQHRPARKSELWGLKLGPISMVCAIFTGALITTQARRKRTSRLDHMWRTDCLSRVWSLLRREIPMTTADTGFAPNMIRHWQDWCISSHMGRRREKYENLLHFRHAPWAVQRRNPLPKSHACKN